jgi:hypothetical protein
VCREILNYMLVLGQGMIRDADAINEPATFGELLEF